ncbi:MAG TPA: PilZ domain-containing protein [Thermoanaerobaculia bacterium]|nr:PilZ domain-containing protein [Thermoanaerobaculia bacterium]
MSPSPDRRHRKRVQLPPGHGNLVVALDGTVLDISLSGMAVETNTRLAPHRPLTLRLGNTDHAMQLTGKVVWCFLHGTRSMASGEQVPVYRAGIQFENVLSPQARRLLDFLEAHAIVTLETRLFGRFRIAEADPVEVSSSAEFKVVELTPQGLTVETGVGLETGNACEVELQLDGTKIEARTRVLESKRVADREQETWLVRLEFEELAEEERAKIVSFVRDELAPPPDEGG